MIVVKIKSKVRQTRFKIDALKPSIISLCLKNEKEEKKSYEALASLHIEDVFLSKYHIVKTQIPTKTPLTTHKLHSLHPFI